MQHIIGLLNNYGNIVLPISLILELIALPLPGEAILTYCGVLVNQGKMNWILSIFVALIGAIIGVTLSYFIGGILGTTFIEKYGHYVHMDKKNLDKVSVWFEKYGNRLLVVTYFIPGVRHITEYFSGITKISYKKFALYSYVGAIIWTSTFISLGSLFGANWDKYHGLVTAFLVRGGVAIFLIAIAIHILIKYKFYLNEVSKEIYRKIANTFNSIVNVSNRPIGMTVSILVLSVVIIGFVE
ncbi:DedA family protein [Clostridium bowmanii]|uniref:DedA family protein n=1 Tax=Clostridium bowmanii TaxID=132925 RepID=UPI001C0D8827|nr:DedA family protein [Clostridium bowmanii]MBU3190777.1 DedA family protein [Clostridium bowmanii]MCA1074977.1 DedA family protein [Clostridium bowmanii]